MKKIFLILITICLFGTGMLLYANFYSKQEIDLQMMLHRWDNGEIEDFEKTKIIEALMVYIRNDEKDALEHIQSLSSYLSIFQINDFKIIQYIENPQFYGSSGRESYHFVMYNDHSKLIESKGSKRIDKITKREEHLFFVFATDYRLSNITGIQIFNIEIDNRSFNMNHMINKVTLPENFMYDDVGKILYYGNEHIYFKEISDKGNEVLITAGDTDFILRLTEENVFEVFVE